MKSPQFLLLSALVLASACELADEAGDVELDQRACEALQAGNAMPIPASNVPDEGAQSVDDDGAQYVVTIPPGGEGYVTFSTPGSGDWIFYLSEDVPVSFSDDEGGTYPVAASSSSSAACPGVVNGRHEVSFPMARIYLVKLGPTQLTEVAIAVEEVDTTGNDALLSFPVPEPQ